eukprot:CAMPEP_0195508106 /NCGR_PEP_ID=MMETSP0794_2-20130614/1408_1 /TAXON_ID=515487 /ORGANISM="Stephanopyxis turris, Strain CCMP 815" /LENGTH=289 /DNA_ID=CAMNT_0040634981 /DNA_START=230 /DNA_END=1099 /DNA_ORIENTATION=+
MRTNRKCFNGYASSVLSQRNAGSVISDAQLDELSSQDYVVIRDFIPNDLVAALRNDVSRLRNNGKFKVARIGQDYTNNLNEDIRVAETCFIGPSKLQDCKDDGRSRLYQILEDLRADLSGNSKFDVVAEDTGELKLAAPALDSKLSEQLYAYYPEGGFYRRHCDAIVGSASVLRAYSLLLYLNEDWNTDDGGELRLHFDSGRDFLPDGEVPNYIDVPPHGGTLVLFKSDKIPHEVLDTKSSRLAVVGWYNRPMTVSDIDSISTESDKTRTIMLLASATLITAGLASILL